MPQLIDSPSLIEAAGQPPKRIEEFLGHVRTGDANISVARMTSPSGWVEPGQTPEFREITVVLYGTLRVEHAGGALEVGGGQVVVVEPGEWVRYSTPGPLGAGYIAICLPAFHPDIVHRDSP